MVKMYYMLKRKPGLSPEEFHRYWRDVHGPLFWNCSGAKEHVVRYEQHHVASDELATSNSEYDGISVFWLESMEAVEALYADAEFRNQVIPDGAEFLDPAFERIITDTTDVFDHH